MRQTLYPLAWSSTIAGPAKPVSTPEDIAASAAVSADFFDKK